MATLDKKELADLYRKRAEHYDLTANLYYLIGFREYAYRKKAVKALNLQPGDVVVEVGCGTGLNFPLLQDAVGPEGKIIGLDLTDRMIGRAEKRVSEHGWSNVELVRCDASGYQFPDHVGGILSTFAITLMPEFDEIIRNGCRALSAGKRWVIADFKMPSNYLSHVSPVLIFLTKPFGVSRELADRHPWESIQKYLRNVSMKEFYSGFVYIAAGEKRERQRHNAKE
jgi:ubiquinone/menaquinone biosynthesis C-methylase UbiE